MKANIKKNDQIKVTVGREKGKTGRVVRVDSEKGQVVVEKLNMIKRHTKPSRANQSGGIVEKEAPLALAKVALVCPKCNKTTRVGRKILEDGKSVRVCKKCNEQMDG